MDQPTIATAFGTLGATCWCIQLLPQIYRNWHRHDTEGLSSSFMMLWACAGVPLGVYNISSNFNIALQVQPQILASLSLTTWAQCLYYRRKWSKFKVAIVAILVAALLGGVEAGLVFAVRNAAGPLRWPGLLMGALAGLLLALGVLEQYVAVYKNRSVEGISFLFCGIDALGDITSIVSVLYEPKIEVVGLVAYSVELALWIGIFCLGGHYRCLPWLRRSMKGVRRHQVAAQNTSEDAIPTTGYLTTDANQSSTSVFRLSCQDEGVRRRADTGSETRM